MAVCSLSSSFSSTYWYPSARGRYTDDDFSPILAALVALVLQLVAGVLTVVIGLLVTLLGGVVGLILGLDFASLAGVLGL